MKRFHIQLALLAQSLLLTSCGFWNLDPAERLAHSLERDAKHLRQSTQSTSSFEFVPSAERAKTSPHFHGDIVVRVAPHQPREPDDASTILVSKWFWTTYHSRFVRVTKPMEASKKPDEPFRIVLKKSGDSIYWTELK